SSTAPARTPATRATGCTATSISKWSTTSSTAPASSPRTPAKRCNRCSPARSTNTGHCSSEPPLSAPSFSSSSIPEGTDGMDVPCNGNCVLTVGTFLPLAGVLVMLFIPRGQELLHKQIALVTMVATAAIGVVALVNFDYNQAGKLQFFADAKWIPV